MKKELKYLLSIVSLSLLSVSLLLVLLNKYASLTFSHFVEVCRQVANDFLSSGLHHAGFVLSIITSITVLIFVSKTIFSYIKTSRKLSSLIDKSTELIPQKLRLVLIRNNISIDNVMLVHSNEDVALTVGWFSPKIVLSNTIVDKLNAKELEVVVLHEYYHLKNKHPFILLIGEILASSLFFVPLLSDLNSKLKSALETEADSFVFKMRGKSNLLDSALLKITTSENFSFYPSFSRRKEYKLRRKSIVMSTIIMFIGLYLYFFPVQTHAQITTQTSALNCDDQLQCSTHCDSISTNMEPSENKTIMSTDNRQSMLSLIQF